MKKNKNHGKTASTKEGWLKKILLHLQDRNSKQVSNRALLG